MLNQSADFTTGDGRRVNVTDIANIYRDVVNQSAPMAGKVQRIGDNSYSLTCHFEATDCDELELIRTTKAYSLQTATRKNDTEKYIESVRCITDPHTLAEVAVATSDNGRFLARLKSQADKAAKEGAAGNKQLLEIWDRTKLLKTIDISELEEHGPICTDPVFSSFHWSPFGEQDKLLYVCKKKQPKYQSFFKQQSDATVISGDTKDRPRGKLVNLGNDHSRIEDWGECLEGIDHTIVAILDVSQGCKIATLDKDGHSLGDARWLDGMRTISVAYPEEPRRLGLIYCNNRPSKLIIHDWTTPVVREVFELSKEGKSYSHPRVSHSGKKFVYLAATTFGPHKRAERLHIYDINSNQDRELVDAKTKEVDHFEVSLSANCFSADDKHLLFVKQDHLYQHMCLYSLEDSTITKIKFPTSGIRLLDFRYDIILATGSELNATPTLFVTALNPVDPGELVAWHQIEDCVHLEEIEYDTYEIPAADGSSFVSAILTTPTVHLLHKKYVVDPKEQVALSSSGATRESDLPTIVLIHGGPHSAFMVSYMVAPVVYAQLGLRTLLINYRGSTGVNEDYIQSLCGKIGKLDIEDCLHVIRHLVKRRKINPKNLVITGGSHGGFISLHLCCQDEFKFTSAIIRNPVVDTASLHAISDIPDWCYTESLNQQKYDPSWVPSSKEMIELFECSPLSRVAQQKNVPTLMLLGNQDLRVPMAQGLRWYETLKARGVKVQCKVYDDRHGLAKPASASDGTITAIMWILSNLQTSS